MGLPKPVILKKKHFPKLRTKWPKNPWPNNPGRKIRAEKSGPKDPWPRVLCTKWPNPMGHAALYDGRRRRWTTWSAQPSSMYGMQPCMWCKFILGFVIKTIAYHLGWYGLHVPLLKTSMTGLWALATLTMAFDSNLYSSSRVSNEWTAAKAD